MKKNNEMFKIYNLENNQKIPIYRLTIDRNEDLEFLRAIALKEMNYRLLQNLLKRILEERNMKKVREFS